MCCSAENQTDRPAWTKKIEAAPCALEQFPLYVFSVWPFELFFFPLLALNCWTSFQWSQWVFFHWLQQTPAGSNSAIDGAWLTACACCDIRSKPHYSSANPELPRWLQGLSWIMQNNQQQDVPRSPLTSGSNMNSGGCLAGRGLFSLSAALWWALLGFHSLSRQPRADLM